MNEHQRCIELAASSIDFRLSAAEQQDLRTHLAVCHSCSVTVRGIREDASRLAAAPHAAAPAAVRDAVIGATHGRAKRGSSGRWPLVAAMLAVLLITGSFVAGSVVERLRTSQVPAPSLPTTVDRATPLPAPTDEQAPRHTPAPTPQAGWHDLGDISNGFGGRTVVSVLPGPGGTLVAFGRDRVTAKPVVWVSTDGIAWNESVLADDVFGGDVPTSGTVQGNVMIVLGRRLSSDGQQRAVWTSTDGRDWVVSPDPSALLDTNADDLTMAAGPRGVILWRPSGDVWVSLDGTTWKTGDVGQQGITDITVDDDGFVAVGRDGAAAFLATSTNGRAWDKPQTQAAAGQVGIERTRDGTEAIWIGDQGWQRSGSSWRDTRTAIVPNVPDPASVVGGATQLLAVGTPTSGDVYRAWTWDGTGDWMAMRTDAEAGSGDPRVIAVAAHDPGWFLLTGRGSTLHGWLVQP